MLRRILIAALLLLSVRPALAISVVFINPGHADEAYWAAVADGMHKAAASLDMNLEVLYAERDHTRVVALTQAVSARPVRPDYLVLTNDYGTAPALLRTLEAAPIPTLIILSGIHGDDRAATGAPRTRYPYWLGSLEPQAADAGYLTARALIDKARRMPTLRDADGKPQMIALAGDRSTPASIERTRGMQRAVDESPEVVLTQIVHADWKRAKAAEQARWLYERYPAARLVWSGSDQIAFGAMQAWRERGGRPGEDALFSGINTSAEALRAVRTGALAALAGGHFMAGAWSMVMLHDHARGRDFADEGLELNAPMFILLDPPRTRRFEQLFGDGAARIDFRRYSKALNPGLSNYHFDFAELLR